VSRRFGSGPSGSTVGEVTIPEDSLRSLTVSWQVIDAPYETNGPPRQDPSWWPGIRNTRRLTPGS
jgi:hypothetical protein